MPTRGRQKVQLSRRVATPAPLPGEERIHTFHCGKCMKELVQAFQCSRCKVERYCSKSCQTNHWTKHKIQCKVWAAAIQCQEQGKDLVTLGAGKQHEPGSLEIKPVQYSRGGRNKKKEKKQAILQRLQAESDRLDNMLSIKQAHNEIAGVPHEAVEQFHRKAEAGEAQAQYTVGMLYRQGDGLVKDAEEAVKWLQKAADQGHPKAQCKLGVMYGKGEGVAQDRKQAMEWFKKASAAGYLEAQLILDKLHTKPVPTKAPSQATSPALACPSDNADPVPDPAPGAAAAPGEGAVFEAAAAVAATAAGTKDRESTPEKDA